MRQAQLNNVADTEMTPHQDRSELAKIEEAIGVQDFRNQVRRHLNTQRPIPEKLVSLMDRILAIARKKFRDDSGNDLICSLATLRTRLSRTPRGDAKHVRYFTNKCLTENKRAKTLN